MASRRLLLVALLSCSLVACIQIPVATLIVQGQDEKALAQINKSAGPPASDPGYRNALPEAVFAGKTEIAKALIDHGAELDAHTNTLEVTPLHYAVHWKTSAIREADVQLLLERGADPNQLNKDGESPLHYIALREIDPTQAEAKERVIRMLLDHGADAGARTSEGLSPIFVSALRGDPDSILQAMVDHGADPTVAQNDGTTPFDHAVANNHLETARFLFDRGATPHVLLEKPTWPKEDLSVYNQFRTSGIGFALFGDWQLEQGETEIAREAFQTAEGQLVLAVAEYRRHAEVAESGVGGAKAGDVGRAAGSVLLTTIGLAAAVATGIGFVSRPVFTNRAAELEELAAKSSAKADECEQLALEMRTKLAALPEPGLPADPGVSPENVSDQVP